VEAQVVGGEADLVDEQVRVVAGPVGGLGPVASGGAQVVGQMAGDAVAEAHEPVDDVEELGDMCELCGVDRCDGLGRVGLLAVAGNRLGGLDIHQIILGVCGKPVLRLIGLSGGCGGCFA